MNRIFLLGDSTCADKSEDKHPETGWGMVLQQLVKKQWQVVNLAENGRSTKSFLEEGLFDRCLGQLSEGDWVFIQFGHNDSKDDEQRHTDPWTTYQGNLILMTDTVLEEKHTRCCLLRSAGGGLTSRATLFRPMETIRRQ